MKNIFFFKFIKLKLKPRFFFKTRKKKKFKTRYIKLFKNKLFSKIFFKCAIYSYFRKRLKKKILSDYIFNALKKLKKISTISAIKKKKYFKKKKKLKHNYFIKKRKNRKILFKYKAIKVKYFKRYFLFINFLNYIYIENKKIKNISNYLFFNNRMLLSSSIKFYASKKKKKKKKTYFFNFWQKKLVTYKKSRLTHWNVYNNGKTLKKRRYKSFFPLFTKLKTLNKIKINDFIFTYFSIKFNLSYNFWKNFSLLYKLFYIQKKKKIYQIPISLKFWVFLKHIKHKSLYVKKKIKKWVYKRWKVRKKFWMKVKKKIPKYFFKQSIMFKGVFNNIHFDFLTNYFSILKVNKNKNTINSFIYNNKLIKLNNFRYKS